MALIIGESFSNYEPMAATQGISQLEITDLVKQFGDLVAKDSLTIVAKSEETKQIIGVLLAYD